MSVEKTRDLVLKYAVPGLPCRQLDALEENISYVVTPSYPKTRGTHPLSSRIKNLTQITSFSTGELSNRGDENRSTHGLKADL